MVVRLDAGRVLVALGLFDVDPGTVELVPALLGLLEELLEQRCVCLAVVLDRCVVDLLEVDHLAHELLDFLVAFEYLVQLLGRGDLLLEHQFARLLVLLDQLGVLRVNGTEHLDERVDLATGNRTRHLVGW